MVTHRGVAAAVLGLGVLGMAACTSGPPAPSPSSSSTPTAAASPAPTAVASTITEPTTTNTLGPPPDPTKAAPTTAGPLTAKSLPSPKGWKKVARDGGVEEGFRGNGTWVREKDPRYAAFELITVGCQEVTRDDYTDPQHALVGDYQSAAGLPGVGQVMQFGSNEDAQDFFNLYVAQVTACADKVDPAKIEIVSSERGLIDRRTYADGAGEWTEVAAVRDRVTTFVILSDPKHKIGETEALAILKQL